MNSVISVIQGIFFLRSGKLLSQHNGDEFCLEEVLRGFIDSEVDILVHYSPDVPINPNLAGGGSCLWGSANCPHGHSSDPSYMFSISRKGILKGMNGTDLLLEDGSVSLLPLEGHKGRVIILSDPVKSNPDQSDSLESLIGDSRKLSELLAGLKSIL